MKKYSLIIFIGLLIVLLSRFYSGGDVSTTRNIEVQESLYDKVIRTGKVEVGYIPYGVSFMKNPNTGEYSGIFYEIMEEVGKRLDLDIEYTYELGWGDMIKSLNNHKVDMVGIGIWPTSSRSKWVDFIDPTYYSSVKGYVRENDMRFDGNLGNINNSNIIIGTIDGEMNSVIAKNDFPKAQINSLSQQSDINQLLLDLVAEKSDVIFLEPSIALEFSVNNPSTIKEIKNVKILRKFPNSMMVNKGEFEFISMVNNVLLEMVNEGMIDDIIDKYEKYEGSFYRINN
ncbi:MAG: amino acid ABC transporter substrate-binding protein [Candidatus Gracilibacteria bacterium]|nr:amino acid ABC transporter substrate-binding protein [Candidatus Gracilibacteria bacterium]